MNPTPYPHHLTWNVLAKTIKINATVVNNRGERYRVVQRLISKVPGAEPRLLLEKLESTTPL